MKILIFAPISVKYIFIVKKTFEHLTFGLKKSPTYVMFYSFYSDRKAVRLTGSPT